MMLMSLERQGGSILAFACFRGPSRHLSSSRRGHLRLTADAASELALPTSIYLRFYMSHASVVADGLDRLGLQR
jgi:hypothetical protein